MIQIKDIEECFEFIQEAIVNKLNDCIAKVNSEKNDSIVLDTFDFSTEEKIEKSIFWDIDEPPEGKKFILIKIDPRISATTVGNSVSKEIRFNVEIFFTTTDSGNNKKDYVRGLRYLEAIERTFKVQSLNFGYTLIAQVPLFSTSKSIQRVQSGVEITFNFA